MQEVVPAAEVAREEIPLSPACGEYLTSEASFGALARLSLRVAFATPLVLFAVCVGLTKLVSRVPLIGWLLAIYGLILTVAGVIVGLVAVPLVAVAMLPVVLLGRRAALREDVASSTAVRQSGTFQVSETSAGGGTLVSPHKKFRLSKQELEGLQPALTTSDEGSSLTGAIVHAVNAGDLLAAYDESGRQLIGVTA
jgi:hypothetical protein